MCVCVAVVLFGGWVSARARLCLRLVGVDAARLTSVRPPKPTIFAIMFPSAPAVCHLVFLLQRARALSSKQGASSTRVPCAKVRAVKVMAKTRIAKDPLHRCLATHLNASAAHRHPLLTRVVCGVGSACPDVGHTSAKLAPARLKLVEVGWPLQGGRSVIVHKSRAILRAAFLCLRVRHRFHLCTLAQGVHGTSRCRGHIVASTPSAVSVQTPSSCGTSRVPDFCHMSLRALPLPWRGDREHRHRDRGAACSHRLSQQRRPSSVSSPAAATARDSSGRPGAARSAERPPLTATKSPVDRRLELGSRSTMHGQSPVGSGCRGPRGGRLGAIAGPTIVLHCGGIAGRMGGVRRPSTTPYG